MTTSFTVDLATAVPPFLSSDVQAKLAYLDQRVQRATLSPDGGSVQIDLASAADDTSLEVLRKRVAALVRDMIEDAFEPDFKVLEQHSGGMSFDTDPMPVLLHNREVVQEGIGYYAFGPLMAAVIEHIDERIRTIASSMGARPYRFPALIAPDYLEKVQYFKNFPHSLSFVTHLNEDLEDIQRFSDEAHTDEHGHVHAAKELFTSPAAMLSPTVCHHLYLGLENTEIASPGLIATAAGNCFRYEAGNMYSLERVWNFTMREIVFVGEDDFVTERLQAVRLAFAEVLKELDLTYSVMTANDPFFVGTFRDQAAYQAAFELKYEIRADVPYRKKTIAVGSYNRHGVFFGRALNIRNSDGSFASTGCFGLGFERVVFALVAQHGPDPKNWPAAIRALAEGVDRSPTFKPNRS